MRLRVAITAGAIALVDLAVIAVALVLGGEQQLVSVRVWNLLLAIGITAVVVAVNALVMPAANAEQLRPDLAALVDGHYTRGVTDALGGGVVKMQRGNSST